MSSGACPPPINLRPSSWPLSRALPRLFASATSHSAAAAFAFTLPSNSPKTRWICSSIFRPIIARSRGRALSAGRTSPKPSSASKSPTSTTSRTHGFSASRLPIALFLLFRAAPKPKVPAPSKLLPDPPCPAPRRGAALLRPLSALSPRLAHFGVRRIDAAFAFGAPRSSPVALCSIPAAFSLVFLSFSSLVETSSESLYHSLFLKYDCFVSLLDTRIPLRHHDGKLVPLPLVFC